MNRFASWIAFAGFAVAPVSGLAVGLAAKERIVPANPIGTLP